MKKSWRLFPLGSLIVVPLLLEGANRIQPNLHLRLSHSRTVIQTRANAAQDTVPAGESAIRLKLSSHLLALANSVAQRSEAATSPSAVAALRSARLPKSVRDALAGRMMRINSAGEVQVYILLNQASSQNVQALRQSGVSIELQDAKSGVVQARIPVTDIQAVAALPFVKYIRPPTYAIPFEGSVDTEGDSILKADQVRSLLHVDGTGVKVGVISDGIKGIFATSCTTCSGVTGGPISTGDLPSATGTRSGGVLVASSGGITAARSFQQNGDLEGIQPGCAFPGAGAEGTALLEIVHDIAPGAQLYFANAATDLEFNQAVDYIDSNADVGLDDLGFVYDLPYDGTSDVSANTAAQLNSSSNRVRGYFTAVGNFAAYHYLSLYTDSGQNFVCPLSICPSGQYGDLHLFQPVAAAKATPDLPATNDALGLGAQPYDVIELPGVSAAAPSGGEAVIVLEWDDRFGASSNNYDLFLVDSATGKVVASSTSSQTGNQDPVEAIDYINSTSSTQTLHILIQNVKNLAQPKHLNMYIFQPECAAAGPKTLDYTTLQDHNFNTYGQSVIAESDAGGSPVSVTSVGATGDILTGQPVNLSESTTIEPYSGIGPTLDGRTKPDIAAVDGVSITGAGNFEVPFYGTSAATPHVGGIAALLLQAASCLKSGATAGSLYTTPAQERQELRNLILDHADPIGNSTPNNIYGYGLVNALNSAKGLIPTANAGSAQTVSGNIATGASLQLDGTGSTDPAGCPLTYNWTGDCGTASGVNASVNCPFGTNTESLTVTNNGVTLSNSTSVQISVTDFAIAASPASNTVIAGSPANFSVTVSPQLGAYSGPITFSCSNLPTGAHCSFSPSSLTPGANSATTTLTISTTSRAVGTPWPFGRMPFMPLLLWVVGLALFTAMFVVFPRPAWRRPRPLILGVVAGLLAAGLLLSASCGGGSAPSPPPPSGTPAGTYQVSVTGANGTLTHSASATIVVQ